MEEWCYYLDGRLVGVGYVDVMPDAAPEGGLSAIYFFYDPDSDRSLGTYNVLCVIEEAQRRGLPYAYLGYYVEGSEGMTYKTRFVPNRLRAQDGEWRNFRESFRLIAAGHFVLGLLHQAVHVGPRRRQSSRSSAGRSAASSPRTPARSESF